MTSKEALKHIANNDDTEIITVHNLTCFGFTKSELINIVEEDLELLNCFLTCFKSAILEATDSQNKRGDNIVADELRDEFGLITLNKLKERLENE